MRQETDSVSMKLLLKQVYAVHSAKIKSLEEEIEDLKKNLQEAELKLKIKSDSECKRCAELEEAFNSCKAALHEQSKWFENLGQKFSTSNAAENKTNQNAAKTLADSTISTKEQSSVSNVAIKKLDLSLNVRNHFLKNVMSLNAEEFPESLDLSSAPFHKNVNPDYSSLIPDSLILAPNTVDFMNQVKGNQYKSAVKENCDINTSAHTDNVCVAAPNPVSNINIKDIARKSVNSTKRLSKKRLSDNSTDAEFIDENLNKEQDIKTGCVDKKLKTTDRNVDYVSLKSVSEHISNDGVSPKDKKSTYIDVKIKSMTNSSKNCFKESVCNNKDDASQITVSPSLIPMNDKSNMPTDLQEMAEDIYDFQISSVNKKTTMEEGTWTSCDKRKLKKKLMNPRPFKSTSRFKMHLDALPPNFKRPSYRQTKLSKSIFQPRSASTDKGDVAVDSDEKSSDFVLNIPSTSADLPVPSFNVKTVDFDATCIPDNYEYEVVSSGNKPLEMTNVSKCDFETSIMIVKDSSDESDEEHSPEMIIEQPSSNKDKQKDKDENMVIKSNLLSENSFDRLPKKAEPNYKYKEETVRKKCERKQLTAFDCNDCEKYYSELGLSDEEKQRRMNKCSRHRSKFAPPPTPEHFWELEFPDTQECKARGYLNKTQKGTLKTHRRRPL